MNCTRNDAEKISAAKAIANGISECGGLYVPETFPVYTHETLLKLKTMSYAERAAKILGDFLPDFSPEEIKKAVTAAYTPEKFPGGAAPLTLLQKNDVNLYVLELWHGPTCAFKDMALQLLPQLLTLSLQKTAPDKTAVILTATSGDTGKAAMEGFRDVPGTKIMVFYPEDGVSAMQKLQMATQEGDNVAVCAIEGNFDDAQAGVKKNLTDPQVRSKIAENGMMFSSANSINFGRLLSQIVYYFSAYCDLMATGELEEIGEKVNFCVPTGNFGNILAAYYAMKMGLPVNRLICASNQNKVLTDFIKTGIYDKNRPFYLTVSPSMDILVSSNLERLIYDLAGSEVTRSCMKALSETGRYEVPGTVKNRIQSLFYGEFCDEEKTKNSLRELWETEHYLVDPHTAVAVGAYETYVSETGDKKTPTVIVSTASPYKFAPAVLSALSGTEVTNTSYERVEELSVLTGVPVPAPIEALRGKPVRFTGAVPVAGMKDAVLNFTKA